MYCISKVSANPCLSWQQYQDWCEWPNFHFYYGESRRWGITSKVTLSVLPAQSRPTLRDPTDSSPPGSSVHGILQARIQEWVTISFSIGIHIASPSWTSFLSPSPSQACRWTQSSCLSLLQHTANSHWLSILHMVIYVSMLLFQSVLPSPSPTVSTSLVFHVCVSTAALQIRSLVLSFYIPYICVSVWYLFFSFWHFTLCNRL